MIVRPLTKAQAVEYCRRHPHAGSLPNSSKYYFGAFDGVKFVGLAVWGWGIVPAQTPVKLFGPGSGITTANYLELGRFFVVNDAPQHAASQFLAITIRLIKKYDTRVKFLYTYAAGFQGLIGTIYKAAGFDYIGTIKCSFLHIPGVGLVHTVALYHRYKCTRKEYIAQLFPNAKRLSGYNFCYLKFICGEEEKAALMRRAKFKVLPYPTKSDLKIWDENKMPVDPEVAKTIPIVKLKSKCVGSVNNNMPRHHLGGEGVRPIPALHAFI